MERTCLLRPERPNYVIVCPLAPARGIYRLIRMFDGLGSICVLWKGQNETTDLRNCSWCGTLQCAQPWKCQCDALQQWIFVPKHLKLATGGAHAIPSPCGSELHANNYRHRHGLMSKRPLHLWCNHKFMSVRCVTQWSSHEKPAKHNVKLNQTHFQWTSCDRWRSRNWFEKGGRQRSFSAGGYLKTRHYVILCASHNSGPLMLSKVLPTNDWIIFISHSFVKTIRSILESMILRIPFFSAACTFITYFPWRVSAWHSSHPKEVPMRSTYEGVLRIRCGEEWRDGNRFGRWNLKKVENILHNKKEKNIWWKGWTKTTFCILLSLKARHLLLKRRVLDEIGQSGCVSIFLAGGGTAFCTWLLHRHPYFRDRREGWRNVRWCHLFPWWWNFRGWWIETRDLFNQGEHCSITWNPKFVVTKLDIKHVEGCQHLGSRWEFKFELIFNQRNPKKPSPNPLWTGV